MFKCERMLVRPFCLLTVTLALVFSCVSISVCEAFANEVANSAATTQDDGSITQTVGPYTIPDSGTNLTVHITVNSEGTVTDTVLKFGPSGTDKTGNINATTLSTYKEYMSYAGITEEQITKIETEEGFTINFTGSFGFLFYGFSSLNDISGLSAWNTSAVNSMSYMFTGCSSLTNVEPLSNWDVSKVTLMSFMFAKCSSLKNIDPLANWDVSKVSSMDYMFARSGIESNYALNGWKPTSLVLADDMFADGTTGTDCLKKVDLTMFGYVPLDESGNLSYLMKSIFDEQKNIEYVILPSNVDVFNAITGQANNAYLTPAGHNTTSASYRYKCGSKILTVEKLKENWSEYAGKELQIVPAKTYQKESMHRLYNPNTGEHFYTSNTDERDHLKEVGWTYEGIGWTAPSDSYTPVYRLYNANAPGGDHHYTTSADERDACVKAGWTDEGIGWYSDDDESVSLYRQYNPNAQAGSHNYTVSQKENDDLVNLGWTAEGVGWYGLSE